jgi:hypothetical protein
MYKGSKKRNDMVENREKLRREIVWWKIGGLGTEVG